MFGRKKPEVLVAGAGPVGLFTALVLAERGVHVQIIDREWRTGTRSYALALHSDVLRMLEPYGLLPEVFEKSLRVRRVGLYEGSERKAEMRVSDLAEDYSFLALLRQDALEGLLERALKKRGVKVDWSHQLAGFTRHQDSLTAAVDTLDKDSVGYGVQHTEWVLSKTRQVEVPWLIGCDGHASRVRRGLEATFEQVGPGLDFGVFEFQTDQKLGDEMRLVMDADVTSLCWPLADGFCRWSFQIPPYDADRDTREKDHDWVQEGIGPYPILTESFLRHQLERRAPWFQGSIGAIRWRTVVRFEQRLTSTFGAGRAWLAGDAAHLTGPAGIQSMNVGLREGRDLAAIVADILHGGGSPAQLEQYQLARRQEWRRLLGLDRGLECLPHTDPWIHKRRERLLPCIPASGDDLTRLAAQVGLVAWPEHGKAKAGAGL